MKAAELRLNFYDNGEGDARGDDCYRPGRSEPSSGHTGGEPETRQLFGGSCALGAVHYRYIWFSQTGP